MKQKNGSDKPTWAKIAIRIMRQQGLTQEDLVETLGVTTRGGVGHYLSGRREPSIDQLKALATRLGLSLAELTEDPVNPESQEPEVLALVRKRLSEASPKEREELLLVLNRILR